MAKDKYKDGRNFIRTTRKEVTPEIIAQRYERLYGKGANNRLLKRTAEEWFIFKREFLKEGELAFRI